MWVREFVDERILGRVQCKKRHEKMSSWSREIALKEGTHSVSISISNPFRPLHYIWGSVRGGLCSLLPSTFYSVLPAPFHVSALAPFNQFSRLLFIFLCSLLLIYLSCCSLIVSLAPCSISKFFAAPCSIFQRMCFTSYLWLPMGKSYLSHYLSIAMVREDPVVYRNLITTSKTEPLFLYSLIVSETYSFCALCSLSYFRPGSSLSWVSRAILSAPWLPLTGVHILLNSPFWKVHNLMIVPIRILNYVRRITAHIQI